MFSVTRDWLKRTLTSLAAGTPVAKFVRQVPATITPVSADGVKSMLRDYAGTHVVIEDRGRPAHVLIADPGRYELRIVPPAVVLRSDTGVERTLERNHPGGLAIFDKEVIYAMVAKESPSTIIGDAIDRPFDLEMISISAGELLETLDRHNYPDILVLELDHSSYALQVKPVVFIPEHSPLFADFRELHRQQGQWGSKG